VQDDGLYEGAQMHAVEHSLLLFCSSFCYCFIKRVTGLEPATFSLGSFSIDWSNRL
jgi:hypothetical protein